MIPDDAVVAAMVPAAVAVIAMMVMVMIVVAIMIVVVMVMVMEKAKTPGVEPDESVVDVEIIVLRRPEATDAGIVGPIAAPLVQAPVAADPVIVVALPIAIVERSAIPLAVEIDRAISDRIIPEIVRAAGAVAIAPRLV